MRRTHGKNHPDKHIRHDPRRNAITVHRDSPVPEQTKQRPGIWPGNGWQMHKRRQSAMAPVCCMLVEKLNDQDNLRGPEIIARPEQDPDEEAKVVDDEVHRDIGGSSDEGAMPGEEVVDVANLGQKEDDPVDVSIRYILRKMCRAGIPVNPRELHVLAKRRGVLVGLLEDTMAMLHIIGRVHRVINAYDDHQRPRERDEDTICRQGRGGVGFMAGKGVVYMVNG